MLGRLAIILTATLLPTFTVAAPADCPPQEQEIAALKELLKYDPETLALEEAQRTRPAFYGVYGYSVSTPGIPENAAKCLSEHAHIKHMPGTSDVLCSSEIINLQPAAVGFAERYNSTLAKAMTSKCL